MKKLALTLGAAATMILSGCAQRIATPSPVSKTNVKLAEAADSVSRSLIELTRVQKATAHKSVHRHKKLVNARATGLQGVASVDWSGPIEPLLKSLARSNNYRFRVLGNRPTIPLIVTLVSHSEPVAAILRNIDYMAGQQANVAINARSRVIELRYATT